MDRAAATTYLTTEYQELVADAGLSNQQVSDAYNLALDIALRQLGVGEADLPTWDVPDSQVLAYLALAGYYTLRRFVRLLSVRVSVTVAGSLSAARNQAATACKAILDDLKAECAARGYPIDVEQATMGYLNLDFQEPSWVGF